jgi:methyl-accepting chemotaxis protein
MLTNMAIPRKLVTSFSLIVLILMSVGGLAFQSLLTIGKNVGWTTHTYQVLEEFGAIIESMVNQETGLRGFIVGAGDRKFLDPYTNGGKAYRVHFDKVKALTSDNAAQQRRLEELDHQVAAWRANVAEKVIEMVGKPETREAGTQIEAGGAGKQYMDDIRGRVAEMDKIERDLLSARSEAMDSANSFARLVIIVGVGGAIALSAALVMILRNALSTPLGQLAGVMKSLADGNTSVEVSGLTRGDEIGEMAKTVQVFLENARQTDQLRARQAAEQAARDKRTQVIDSLTADFDSTVSGMLDKVSNAATRMTGTSQTLSANAEQTNKQAAIVAAASEEASTSVQTVASAAEELSSSIGEIGRQVEQSSRITKSASEEAYRTNEMVKGLAESSSKIGDVVKLINDIASQTNLLALNATKFRSIKQVQSSPCRTPLSLAA